MNIINRITKSRYVSLIVCGGIFIIMLTCNLLTDLCADDFIYLYSFKDGERIRSLWQIFPSLAAHRITMNGRLIAHFFVQLFLMLPHTVFKAVNSAFFLIQILLIYKISKKPGERNNWLIIAIFCMIWIYEPAFGQVNLWLDGACNYLWSAAFGLLFLIPAINCFLDKEKDWSLWKTIPYVLCGFAAGGYLENFSGSIIFMDFVLLMLIQFYKKKKVKLRYIIGFIASLISFALMFTAPGEIKNKVAQASLQFYRKNFINAVETYKIFWVLAGFFIVLLVFAVFMKINKDRIGVSIVFALGSLCANFMFIVASYYPLRCAFSSVIFIVTADAILMAELFSTRYKVILTAIVGVLMIVTFYYGSIGMNDIYVVHSSMEKNINYIQQCREEGNLDVEVPLVHSYNKYSAMNESKYLDTSDRSTWPNSFMARYYGINSIIGR